MPKATGARPTSHRLPVNPRRHKVAPEKRKRVATACNSCNVRRIKCSGEKPCRQCKTTSRDCQYPVAIEKISIPRSELDDLKARCDLLESALLEVTGGSLPPCFASDGYMSTVPLDSPSSSTQTLSDEEHSAADTEYRWLHDVDDTARYLGESSDATFLDSLKTFMANILPMAACHGEMEPMSGSYGSGSAFLALARCYETFDSGPLYDYVPNVDPLCLPSTNDMQHMLSGLRYLIQDGNGDFASGGIFYWGDLATAPQLRPTPAMGLQHNRHLALYHTAFAIAELLGLSGHSARNEDRSLTHFVRARILTGDPLDMQYAASDIATLTLMGLCMLEMDRRDHAHAYVGAALHLAVRHGVHRGWSAGGEPGRRVFWTAYVLDRWLGCLTGRPPSLHDDAVRLDLPRDAPGLPPSAGLRAHVELAHISGYIVRGGTGRAAPWDVSGGQAASRVDRALLMLAEWRRNLPLELQMPADGGGGADRAACMLHMHYNQLLILAIRPIFFVALKKAVAGRVAERQRPAISNATAARPQPQPPQAHHLDAVRACGDAARRNLRLGRWLARAADKAPPGPSLPPPPLLPLLQAELHHVFGAAAVLLLQGLVFATPRADDGADIAFAAGALAQAAAAGFRYARDCAGVLADLGCLVERARGLSFVGSLAAPPAGFGLSVVMAYGTPQVDVGRVPPYGGLADEEGHPAFQEFATWLDRDDAQLYDNYLV